MEAIIHLGSKPITFKLKSFEDEVDVDTLLTIDYSNLYGEAVTIPALMNHMGVLKAETERTWSTKKAELDFYDAELRKRIRKEHAETAQKITEAGLNELVEVDPGFKIKKKNVITAKYNLDVMDSMFWAVSAKNKKLDNLVKGVTPEELFQELQEGVINNVLIKKHKSIVDR